LTGADERRNESSGMLNRKKAKNMLLILMAVLLYDDGREQLD